MKNIATFQGVTKEELELRILNIENSLKNNEMESWEARELNEVINEYKRQISCINYNQSLLDSL